MGWKKKNSTKLLSTLCIPTFCHSCGAEKELSPEKNKIFTARAITTKV
jgi:hypothetical protein